MRQRVRERDREEERKRERERERKKERERNKKEERNIIVPLTFPSFSPQSYFAMLDGGQHIIFLSITGMLFTFFAIGLAIGVVVSVGGLWVIQMRSILRNETGIESWIREKAQYRERSPDEPRQFRFPYDLGRKRNFREVRAAATLCPSRSLPARQPPSLSTGDHLERCDARGRHLLADPGGLRRIRPYGEAGKSN